MSAFQLYDKHNRGLLDPKEIVNAFEEFDYLKKDNDLLVSKFKDLLERYPDGIDKPTLLEEVQKFDTDSKEYLD